MLTNVVLIEKKYSPVVVMRIPPLTSVFLLQSLDHLARVACSDAARRNALHHHTAGTDDGASADGDALQDDAPRPYQHMVFDDNGSALGSVVVHGLTCGEHLTRVTHAPVEVVGVRVHDDAVAPDVHIVSNSNPVLSPDARRRHSHMMTYLYDCLRTLCHDTSALVTADGVDDVVGGKGEVVAYPHRRLGVDAEVDVVEHRSPLAQISPSDSQSQAYAVVADEEVSAEEERHPWEFFEKIFYCHHRLSTHLTVRQWQRRDTYSVAFTPPYEV